MAIADRHANAGLRTLYRPALTAFGILLLIRSLSVFSVYFFHVDEVSIAAGAAALVRDNVAGVYNYTPQIGYYRLVEWIDLMLGGHVSFIPGIVKGLSALAGAVIPTLGLFAFANELTLRERWLTALSLAVNPIIWTSSQYGNTAMAATALATAGLVILSNNPRPIARIGALALFAGAAFVRADTVLLAPLAFFLLYRNDRSIRVALTWGTVFGVVMVLAYAAIVAFDPRASNALAAVANHMSTDNPSRFWGYLLWTMSPIPLVASLWGLRRLLRERPLVCVALALWCGPTLLFYSPAATIPRYFLNVVVPLSMAAAVGLEDAAKRLQPRLGSLAGRTAIVGVASAHLIIGFGYLTRGARLPAPFAGGSAPTQGGEVLPTGALIYRTVANRGILAWSLPTPHFGKSRHFSEPRTFGKALEILADEAAPPRTVVILLAGGFSYAFHYHAQVAGARYVSRRPRDGSGSLGGETWLEIGRARVETITWRMPFYGWVPRFDIAAGDEIWVLGRNAFPDAESLKKMPPGLSLVAAESFDPDIRVFRVAGGQAASS